MLERSGSVAGIYVAEKERDGNDFRLALGDDFLLRPRRAAVGLMGTLLRMERSVREAPLK